MSEQLFEAHANRTLHRVTQTYAQRGTEYADTWRNAQWLAVQATAKRIGLNLSLDQCRLLAAAALVDTKYVRLSGGYKDDSVIDGIAYSAFWAEAMREYEQNNQGQHSRGVDRESRPTANETEKT